MPALKFPFPIRKSINFSIDLVLLSIIIIINLIESFIHQILSFPQISIKSLADIEKFFRCWYKFSIVISTFQSWSFDRYWAEKSCSLSWEFRESFPHFYKFATNSLIMWRASNSRSIQLDCKNEFKRRRSFELNV